MSNDKMKMRTSEINPCLVAVMNEMLTSGTDPCLVAVKMKRTLVGLTHVQWQ